MSEELASSNELRALFASFYEAIDEVRCHNVVYVRVHMVVQEDCVPQGLVNAMEGMRAALLEAFGWEMHADEEDGPTIVEQQ